MNPLTFCMLAALAASPSANLAAAEAAYDGGRFQEVLPLVELALKEPLEVSQTVRAHALAAHVHAAFHQNPAAVQDFRAALAADPAYRLPPAESPKIQDLFAQALGQSLLLSPPARVSEPARNSALGVESTSPSARKPAKVPWLAIGLTAGAIVVAGVVTAVVLVEDRPAGNLGRASLP